MSNYWSPQYILCTPESPNRSYLSSPSSLADNFGMASGWSNRHHQQDHIPSTSDNPSPAAAQQQIATRSRPDVENAIQDCPCSWCSRPRYDYQVTSHTRDYPAPWFPNVRTIYSEVALSSSERSSLKNSVAQFANESLGITHPTGITTVTNGQMMVRPVDQQAPWDQENEWYAPRYDAAGSLQAHTSAAPYQAQIDMPVQNSLRCFAERYFSNPESLINAVHFEHGPSGRLQVVIRLEITDIL
ncbi:hypothetical protein F5888DRAFT_1635432 [Russula emetica]|nr:hypothetical protein F5888DRAFT_1635432 [Russula emetica]